MQGFVWRPRPDFALLHPAKDDVKRGVFEARCPRATKLWRDIASAPYRNAPITSRHSAKKTQCPRAQHEPQGGVQHALNLFFAKEKTSLRPSNRSKENEGELRRGAVICELFAAGATVNAERLGAASVTIQYFFSIRHFPRSKAAPRHSLKQPQAASGF